MPEGSYPRATFMILTASNRRGALEDLCMEAIIQNPPIVFVEQFFDILIANGIGLPKNLSKAKV